MRKKSHIDWNTCGRCGNRKTVVSGLPFCETCGETAFYGSWDSRPRGFERVLPTDPEPQKFRFRDKKYNTELDF
jgi:hypothetical protein